MKKLRVGILFGGRSGEHEVSLLSAASVLNAIDRNKYEVVPIGITKEGRWLTAAEAQNLLQGKSTAAGEDARAKQGHLRAGDPEATPGAAVLPRRSPARPLPAWLPGRPRAGVPPEPEKAGRALGPVQT